MTMVQNEAVVLEETEITFFSGRAQDGNARLICRLHMAHACLLMLVWPWSHSVFSLYDN
jgi:hypothetical protein